MDLDDGISYINGRNYAVYAVFLSGGQQHNGISHCFFWNGDNECHYVFASSICVGKREKMYQLQLLQESNKEKMQAFYETSAANEFQKRILHDYGNQLNCIQGLLKEKQYNKAQEYTEKLTDTICEGMDVVSVNNPVINIILNQKYHMAEDKGIAMIFQLNDLSKVWLEEQDLVILISNLLDNAIEACDKSGDKIIRLKIVLEKKEMVVSVKNTVNR